MKKITTIAFIFGLISFLIPHNAQAICSGIAVGGTGACTFTQGWVYAPGGTNPLTSSTSPTVDHIIATSTSNFNYFGAAISAPCFSNDNFTSCLNNNVAGIQNLDGSLSVTSSSGIYTLSLNTANANSWTAPQTFSGSLANGIRVGSVELYEPVTGTLRVIGLLTATNGFSGDGSLITGVPINSGTSGTLNVNRGGTGQTSFGQGWLSSDGSIITSSTSPTVNYITSTSTTATSTFGYGINLSSKGCFAINSTCITSSSGTVNSGVFGQATYYGANGTAVSGTSSLVIGTTTADANNVGIGTTTPWGLLSVNANGLTSSRAQFVVGSSTATNLTVGNNGFVGVGTPSPKYRVDIRGSSDAPALLHFGDSPADDGGYITSVGTSNMFISGGASFDSSLGWVAKASTASLVGGDTGQFRFYTDSGLTPGSVYSPTVRMLIDASGNVGIGTSFPATGLDVNNGDVAVHTGRLNFSYAGSNPGSGPAVKWSDGGNTNVIGLYINNGLIFQGNSGNPDFFVASPTTNGSLGTNVVKLGGSGSSDVSYFNGGNLGVGTVSPDSALDVNGTVRFEGSSSFVTTSISGAIIGIGCDTADTTGLTGLASTTAFVTTPESFPGNGLFTYTMALTSTSARTFVCSAVTVTPNASTYVVKIIR